MGEYLDVTRAALERIRKERETPSSGASVQPTKSEISERCEVSLSSAVRRFGAEFSDGITSLPDVWRQGVLRLLAMPCPPAVSTKAWAAMIHVSIRTVASGRAAEAASLGWEALDLWGCHSDKPYQRLDCAGLVWLLTGNEVIDLTAGTATIRTRAGATQTHRRRPSVTTEICLAWELTTGQRS